MSDAEEQPVAPTEPNLEKESILPETDTESKDVKDNSDAEKVPCSVDDNEIKVEVASPEKVPEENELDFEDEPAVNGKLKEASAIEVKEEKKEADRDTTQSEEGLCTPPHDKNKKTEETKDDGECSDGGDEDLEEGELNEKEDMGGGATNSKPTSATKSLCRFYSRGQCFFGANCRFAHINSAGNYYSMFGSTPARAYDTSYYDTTGLMSHRSGPLPSRSGSDFVPPPSACSQPAPAEECAWVRGLETAKELVKRANKRKIEDKNFSEKSLNLSLDKNEKNVEFIERDTRDGYKRKRRDVQFPKYDEPLEAAYDDYREPYREVGFDNFDVRYHTHREERRADRRMDRGEPRDKREFRPPKSPRSKERYRDDRLEEVEPPPRPRDYSRNVTNGGVNSFFDPWRRSKSPKGTARRSRSRSGSYSSVSSYSWSDRSFSSNSYSRTSRSSSRSPPPHQKRKPSPTITNPPFVSERPGPLLTNTFTTMREKKPPGLPSRSRTPSISRSSRSFSRSISMSSVSSASSARASSRDRDSLSNSSGSRSGRQNSTSILRKQDENPALPVGKTVDPPKVSGPPPAAVPLSSMYLNYPLRENTTMMHDTIESPIIEESEPDPLEEQFLHPQKPEIEKPFPSLQHLLPTCDKVREPLKVAPHKQQIKLTLLPKKELDRKLIGDDPSKSTGFYFGVKGPLSPPTPPVIAKPTPVLVPKKSASSRRDELLKQLKAVEDAIARKRAKFG